MNEPDRLTRLIAAHGSAVGNYLSRRIYPLSASELDDLVEETFVVAWRRSHQVPTGPDERPWIIGVARNVLHNAKRANGRRLHHEMSAPPTNDSPSAEDEAIAQISGQLALDNLGRADREILTLHFWDGIEVDGLATVLGITTNAAGTRLTRAKARFVDSVRAFASDDGYPSVSAKKVERKAI